MHRLDFLHPRDEILHAMERIYRYRMTTTSGGNISVVDEAGELWITPARVDKGDLRRPDIVCVHRDGSAEGPHPPSSELPFHQAIYAARPDLRGIVHAHPVALVAFSMTRQTPETRLFPQAHHVCGEVGFAPYALPGSQSLAANIARTFAAGYYCVVLENHGVVVGGATLTEAFQRFEALEFAAKTWIKARMLGTPRILTEDQLRLAACRAPFGLEAVGGDGANLAAPAARQANPGGEPPSVWAPSSAARPPALPPLGSRERELRRQLGEFVRRGCRQRLLISTEGSFSARVEQDAFLITPSQQDRYTLELEDLVLVQGDACEPGKKPSRATRIHQALYRRYPQVKAIVFAHPVNATAFSVTDSVLDARTIPESYILLRDVQRIPFGLQYQDGPALAAVVSPENPAALLENDGAVVLGQSVFDAFDRLEVLESTCEAVINSRQLGPVQPMPAEVIAELRAAFFKKS